MTTASKTTMRNKRRFMFRYFWFTTPGRRGIKKSPVTAWRRGVQAA
jgi:hypothetical protein